MKRQTFIAYIVNENDTMINFERFSYKRLETVERSMKEAFKSELYRICKEGRKNEKIHCNRSRLPGF